MKARLTFTTVAMKVDGGENQDPGPSSEACKFFFLDPLPGTCTVPGTLVGALEIFLLS